MFQNGEHQDELKLMVVTRICVPLLHHMSSSAALELCIKYTPALTTILCPSVPRFIINPSEKKGSLVEKTCAFKLMEVSFNHRGVNSRPSRAFAQSVARIF